MCSYRKQPICLYLIEAIRFWVSCTRQSVKSAAWSLRMSRAEHRRPSVGCLLVNKYYTLLVRESTCVNKKYLVDRELLWYLLLRIIPLVHLGKWSLDVSQQGVWPAAVLVPLWPHLRQTEKRRQSEERHSHQDSSSLHHECRCKTSWQSIP